MAKLANKCLRRKNLGKRTACINEPNRWNVEERLWQGCRAQLNPVKDNFIAQERRTYPKQGSAFDADRDRDNDRRRDNGNYSNNGDMKNNGGNMTATDAECRPLAKRMERLAKKCLKRKRLEKRTACVNKPDSWNVEERLWQGCRKQIDPIKQMFLTQEKRRFPKQGSAFDRNDGGKHADNGGHHNGGNHGNMTDEDRRINGGNMQASAQECKPLMKRLEKLAKKCVRRKTTAKRNRCLDKTDSWNVEERLWQGCEEYKRPIKEMFMSEERRMYPKQASPAECKKLSKRMNKLAKRCLKRKKLKNRIACVNKPDSWNVEERLWQGCRPQIDPIKQMFLSEEKRRYPKQCFDYIGKMLQTRKYKGKAIGDLCGPVFEPIKDEYRNREAKKWPNDPSSFE